MLRTFTILMSLGSLAGCALSSQRYEDLRATAYRPLFQVQRRPTAPSKTPLPATVMIDPFRGKKVLDLNDLIAEVERRNPSLTAKLYALRAVINRYPQVTSLDDPRLSYGMTPASIGQGGLDFGQKIELSQRLPWPGKRSLRGEIVLNDADAARMDMETLRQQLVQQAGTAYINYYFVFRAIEINEVNKSLLADFRKIAEVKYAAGTAAKQDVLQAEVEHNHLLHRGIVLERMRKLAIARVNVLLNRMPDLHLPPPPDTLGQPGPRPKVAKLRALAIEQRPELQALVARIRGSQAATALARKNYYPDFTVMGAYNSLWMRDEHRGMIGVAINIPLALDRRRGAESEALARVAQLQAELASGVSKVAMEIQEAYDQLVESEHIVHLYRTKLIPAVKQNLAAAHSGYQSDKNDFLTLIMAEKHLMMTRLEYQKALAGYHRHWTDLEKALGGPLPVEPLPQDHSKEPKP